MFDPNNQIAPCTQEEWEWKYFVKNNYFLATCQLCTVPTYPVTYWDIRFLFDHYKQKHSHIEKDVKIHSMHKYFARINNSKMKCLSCFYIISNTPTILKNHLFTHNIIVEETTYYQSSFVSNCVIVSSFYVLCKECYEPLNLIFMRHMNHHIFEKHNKVWNEEQRNASVQREETSRYVSLFQYWSKFLSNQR